MVQGITPYCYTTPHHTTPRQAKPPHTPPTPTPTPHPQPPPPPPHPTPHHPTPPHPTPPHPTPPHHTTPHHTTPHHTTPHHTTPHHTTPHHTTSDQQRHLVAHRMRNLPTMTVLAEHSQHRNVQLCRRCLLCGGCPETVQHLWECPVQSHEWQPARQRLHTRLSTYVGP